MLNKVKEYIKKYELKEGDSVLLACSGGIDSMVLFDILKKLNIDFCVAHCNFMLRGDESIGDEKFVKENCEKVEVLYLRKKESPDMVDFGLIEKEYEKRGLSFRPVFISFSKPLKKYEVDYPN